MVNNHTFSGLAAPDYACRECGQSALALIHHQCGCCMPNGGHDDDCELRLDLLDAHRPTSPQRHPGVAELLWIMRGCQHLRDGSRIRGHKACTFAKRDKILAFLDAYYIPLTPEDRGLFT